MKIGICLDVGLRNLVRTIEDKTQGTVRVAPVFHQIHLMVRDYTFPASSLFALPDHEGGTIWIFRQPMEFGKFPSFADI